MSWLAKILRRGAAPACFGRTDTGRTRSSNEDSFAVLEEKGLLIVADGMGGHRAGEVASRLAVECLIRYFSATRLREIRGDRDEIRHHLLRSFVETNGEVMAAATARAEHRGMGCTLLVGLLDGNTLHTCHVGDVRCYELTGGKLVQITGDHSLAAAGTGGSGLTGNGEATGRNVVTRAIGYPFREGPEHHAVPLARGDRVLLCSDGLWSMVADSVISRLMSTAATPEETCDTLIDAANEAGGRDNITAVVVWYG